MSEAPSKRVDDLHKRFDDLRADMSHRFERVDQRFDEVDRRFGELQGDMNRRFTELRGDMNQRFNDMNQTLKTFMWIISGWFTFLTALMAVFGFLRLRLKLRSVHHSS